MHHFFKRQKCTLDTVQACFQTVFRNFWSEMESMVSAYMNPIFRYMNQSITRISEMESMVSAYMNPIFRYMNQSITRISLDAPLFQTTKMHLGHCCFQAVFCNFLCIMMSGTCRSHVCKIIFLYEERVLASFLAFESVTYLQAANINTVRQAWLLQLSA